MLKLTTGNHQQHPEHTRNIMGGPQKPKKPLVPDFNLIPLGEAAKVARSKLKSTRQPARGWEALTKSVVIQSYPTAGLLKSWVRIYGIEQGTNGTSNTDKTSSTWKVLDYRGINYFRSCTVETNFWVFVCVIPDLNRAIEKIRKNDEKRDPNNADGLTNSCKPWSLNPYLRVLSFIEDPHLVASMFPSFPAGHACRIEAATRFGYRLNSAIAVFQL